MQDIGGCRVVLPEVKDVYRFIDEIGKSSVKHIAKERYDYIRSPKQSGYRSVHIVYQYKSDKRPEYSGLLVEIQIRTKLQHMWATALEAIGASQNAALKAGEGDQAILRFFQLVSGLFALEENQPVASNIPPNRDDIVFELRRVNETNNVLGKLRAIKAMTARYSNNPRKSKREEYYLLDMDYGAYRMQITRFAKSEIGEATKQYGALEARNSLMLSEKDAVLIAASSIRKLKAMYPNYFADLTRFTEKVNGYISE